MVDTVEVPREPSQRMIDAGSLVLGAVAESGGGPYLYSDATLAVYRAMVGCALFDAACAPAMIAAIQQSPISTEGWRSTDTLPHPRDAGMFWAAIRTCGINSPLQWEVHAIALDDETHDVADYFYQGWNIDQYEFWQPCTTPPVPSVSGGEDQGSNRKGDLPTEQPADGSSSNEGEGT